MTEYTPDNWVVIHIKGDNPHYRVLAGWSGGYTQGSSWKLNSGITRVEFNDPYYEIYGSSGSCYICHKESYCLRMNNAYIWNSLQEKYGENVELLEEDNDWLNFDWLIT
jgi:hypothetical protein